ncbi:hypothetical protein KC342_g125 [Hortaea werneckii]|nr:hypothetical protein KC342_g125 [Hortaea werneckii]
MLITAPLEALYLDVVHVIRCLLSCCRGRPLDTSSRPRGGKASAIRNERTILAPDYGNGIWDHFEEVVLIFKLPAVDAIKPWRCCKRCEVMLGPTWSENTPWTPDCLLRVVSLHSAVVHEQFQGRSRILPWLQHGFCTTPSVPTRPAKATAERMFPPAAHR